MAYILDEEETKKFGTDIESIRKEEEAKLAASNKIQYESGNAQKFYNEAKEEKKLWNGKVQDNWDDLVGLDAFNYVVDIDNMANFIGHEMGKDYDMDGSGTTPEKLRRLLRSHGDTLDGVKLRTIHDFVSNVYEDAKSHRNWFEKAGDYLSSGTQQIIDSHKANVLYGQYEAASTPEEKEAVKAKMISLSKNAEDRAILNPRQYDSFEDVDSVSDAIGYMTQEFLNIAPQIGVTTAVNAIPVVGTAVSGGLLLSQMTGDVMLRRVSEGEDPTLLPALGEGIVDTALERATFGGGSKLFKSFKKLAKASKGARHNYVKSFGKEFVKGTLGEVATEEAQMFTDLASNKILTGSWLGKDQTWADVGGEAAEIAWATAFAVAPLEGASNISTERRYAKDLKLANMRLKDAPIMENVKAYVEAGGFSGLSDDDRIATAQALAAKNTAAGAENALKHWDEYCKQMGYKSEEEKEKAKKRFENDKAVSNAKLSEFNENASENAKAVFNSYTSEFDYQNINAETPEGFVSDSIVDTRALFSDFKKEERGEYLNSIDPTTGIRMNIRRAENKQFELNEDGSFDLTKLEGDDVIVLYPAEGDLLPANYKPFFMLSEYEDTINETTGIVTESAFSKLLADLSEEANKLHSYSQYRKNDLAKKTEAIKKLVENQGRANNAVVVGDIDSLVNAEIQKNLSVGMSTEEALEKAMNSAPGILFGVHNADSGTKGFTVTQKTIDNLEKRGLPPGILGDVGTFYIFADKIETNLDLITTVRHEEVHAELQRFLKQYGIGEKEIEWAKRLISKMGLDSSGEWEEKLARHAEFGNFDVSLIKKMQISVMNFLDKHGLRKQGDRVLSDAESIMLLSNVFKYNGEGNANVIVPGTENIVAPMGDVQQQNIQQGNLGVYQDLTGRIEQRGREQASQQLASDEQINSKMQQFDELINKVITHVELFEKTQQDIQNRSRLMDSVINEIDTAFNNGLISYNQLNQLNGMLQEQGRTETERIDSVLRTIAGYNKSMQYNAATNMRLKYLPQQKTVEDYRSDKSRQEYRDSVTKADTKRYEEYQLNKERELAEQERIAKQEREAKHDSNINSIRAQRLSIQLKKQTAKKQEAELQAALERMDNASNEEKQIIEQAIKEQKELNKKLSRESKTNEILKKLETRKTEQRLFDESEKRVNDAITANDLVDTNDSVVNWDVATPKEIANEYFNKLNNLSESIGEIATYEEDEENSKILEALSKSIKNKTDILKKGTNIKSKDFDVIPILQDEINKIVDKVINSVDKNHKQNLLLGAEKNTIRETFNKFNNTINDVLSKKETATQNKGGIVKNDKGTPTVVQSVTNTKTESSTASEGTKDTNKKEPEVQKEEGATGTPASETVTEGKPEGKPEENPEENPKGESEVNVGETASKNTEPPSNKTEAESENKTEKGKDIITNDEKREEYQDLINNATNRLYDLDEEYPDARETIGIYADILDKVSASLDDLDMFSKHTLKMIIDGINEGYDIINKAPGLTEEIKEEMISVVDNLKESILNRSKILTKIEKNAFMQKTKSTSISIDGKVVIDGDTSNLVKTIIKNEIPPSKVKELINSLDIPKENNLRLAMFLTKFMSEYGKLVHADRVTKALRREMSFLYYVFGHTKSSMKGQVFNLFTRDKDEAQKITNKIRNEYNKIIKELKESSPEATLMKVLLLRKLYETELKKYLSGRQLNEFNKRESEYRLQAIPENFDINKDAFDIELDIRREAYEMLEEYNPDLAKKYKSILIDKIGSGKTALYELGYELLSTRNKAFNMAMDIARLASQTLDEDEAHKRKRQKLVNDLLTYGKGTTAPVYTNEDYQFTSFLGINISKKNDQDKQLMNAIFQIMANDGLLSSSVIPANKAFIQASMAKAIINKYVKDFPLVTSINSKVGKETTENEQVDNFSGIIDKIVKVSVLGDVGVGEAQNICNEVVRILKNNLKAGKPNAVFKKLLYLNGLNKSKSEIFSIVSKKMSDLKQEIDSSSQEVKDNLINEYEEELSFMKDFFNNASTKYAYDVDKSIKNLTSLAQDWLKLVKDTESNESKDKNEEASIEVKIEDSLTNRRIKSDTQPLMTENLHTLNILNIVCEQLLRNNAMTMDLSGLSLPIKSFADFEKFKKNFKEAIRYQNVANTVQLSVNDIVINGESVPKEMYPNKIENVSDFVKIYFSIKKALNEGKSVGLKVSTSDTRFNQILTLTDIVNNYAHGKEFPIEINSIEELESLKDRYLETTNAFSSKNGVGFSNAIKDVEKEENNFTSNIWTLARIMALHTYGETLPFDLVYTMDGNTITEIKFAGENQPEFEKLIKKANIKVDGEVLALALHSRLEFYSLERGNTITYSKILNSINNLQNIKNDKKLIESYNNINNEISLIVGDESITPPIIDISYLFDDNSNVYKNNKELFKAYNDKLLEYDILPTPQIEADTNRRFSAYNKALRKLRKPIAKDAKKVDSSVELTEKKEPTTEDINALIDLLRTNESKVVSDLMMIYSICEENLAKEDVENKEYLIAEKEKAMKELMSSIYADNKVVQSFLASINSNKEDDLPVENNSPTESDESSETETTKIEEKKESSYPTTPTKNNGYEAKDGSLRGSNGSLLKKVSIEEVKIPNKEKLTGTDFYIDSIGLYYNDKLQRISSVDGEVFEKETPVKTETNEEVSGDESNKLEDIDFDDGWEPGEAQEYTDSRVSITPTPEKGIIKDRASLHSLGTVILDNSQKLSEQPNKNNFWELDALNKFKAKVSMVLGFGSFIRYKEVVQSGKAGNVRIKEPSRKELKDFNKLVDSYLETSNKIIDAYENHDEDYNVSNMLSSLKKIKEDIKTFLTEKNNSVLNDPSIREKLTDVEINELKLTPLDQNKTIVKMVSEEVLAKAKVDRSTGDLFNALFNVIDKKLNLTISGYIAKKGSSPDNELQIIQHSALRNHYNTILDLISVAMKAVDKTSNLSATEKNKVMESLYELQSSFLDGYVNAEKSVDKLKTNNKNFRGLAKAYQDSLFYKSEWRTIATTTLFSPYWITNDLIQEWEKDKSEEKLFPERTTLYKINKESAAYPSLDKGSYLDVLKNFDNAWKESNPDSDFSISNKVIEYRKNSIERILEIEKELKKDPDLSLLNEVDIRNLAIVLGRKELAVSECYLKINLLDQIKSNADIEFAEADKNFKNRFVAPDIAEIEGKIQSFYVELNSISTSEDVLKSIEKAEKEINDIDKQIHEYDKKVNTLTSSISRANKTLKKREEQILLKNEENELFSETIIKDIEEGENQFSKESLNNVYESTEYNYIPVSAREKMTDVSDYLITAFLIAMQKHPSGVLALLERTVKDTGISFQKFLTHLNTISPRSKGRLSQKERYMNEAIEKYPIVSFLSDVLRKVAVTERGDLIFKETPEGDVSLNTDVNTKFESLLKKEFGNTSEFNGFLDALKIKDIDTLKIKYKNTFDKILSVFDQRLHPETRSRVMPHEELSLQDFKNFSSIFYANNPGEQVISKDDKKFIENFLATLTNSFNKKKVDGIFAELTKFVADKYVERLNNAFSKFILSAFNSDAADVYVDEEMFDFLNNLKDNNSLNLSTEMKDYLNAIVDNIENGIYPEFLTHDVTVAKARQSLKESIREKEEQLVNLTHKIENSDLFNDDVNSKALKDKDDIVQKIEKDKFELNQFYKTKLEKLLGVLQKFKENASYELLKDLEKTLKSIKKNPNATYGDLMKTKNLVSGMLFAEKDIALNTDYAMNEYANEFIQSLHIIRNLIKGHKGTLDTMLLNVEESQALDLLAVMARFASRDKKVAYKRLVEKFFGDPEKDKSTNDFLSSLEDNAMFGVVEEANLYPEDDAKKSEIARLFSIVPYIDGSSSGRKFDFNPTAQKAIIDTISKTLGKYYEVFISRLMNEYSSNENKLRSLIKTQLATELKTAKKNITEEDISKYLSDMALDFEKFIRKDNAKAEGKDDTISYSDLQVSLYNFVEYQKILNKTNRPKEINNKFIDLVYVLSVMNNVIRDQQVSGNVARRAKYSHLLENAITKLQEAEANDYKSAINSSRKQIENIRKDLNEPIAYTTEDFEGVFFKAQSEKENITKDIPGTVVDFLTIDSSNVLFNNLSNALEMFIKKYSNSHSSVANLYPSLIGNKVRALASFMSILNAVSNSNYDVVVKNGKTVYANSATKLPQMRIAKKGRPVSSIDTLTSNIENYKNEREKINAMIDSLKERKNSKESFKNALISEKVNKVDISSISEQAKSFIDKDVLNFFTKYKESNRAGKPDISVDIIKTVRFRTVFVPVSKTRDQMNAIRRQYDLPQIKHTSINRKELRNDVAELLAKDPDAPMKRITNLIKAYNRTQKIPQDISRMDLDIIQIGINEIDKAYTNATNLLKKLKETKGVSQEKISEVEEIAASLRADMSSATMLNEKISSEAGRTLQAYVKEYPSFTKASLYADVSNAANRQLTKAEISTLENLSDEMSSNVNRLNSIISGFRSTSAEIDNALNNTRDAVVGNPNKVNAINDFVNNQITKAINGEVNPGEAISVPHLVSAMVVNVISENPKLVNTKVFSEVAKKINDVCSPLGFSMTTDEVKGVWLGEGAGSTKYGRTNGFSVDDVLRVHGVKIRGYSLSEDESENDSSYVHDILGALAKRSAQLDKDIDDLLNGYGPRTNKRLEKIAKDPKVTASVRDVKEKERKRKMLINEKLREGYSGIRKLWDSSLMIKDFLKSIRASGDMSGIGIQAGWAVLGHPKAGIAAFKNGIKALMDSENAQEIINNLTIGEAAQRRRDAGLQISVLSSSQGPLAEMEETFAREISSLSSLKDSKATRAIDWWLKKSEETYVVPLDVIRAMVFDSICEATGRNKSLSAVEEAMIARCVNAATGKGTFFGNREIMNAMSKVLWSPARLAGQVETLVLPFVVGANTQISTDVKMAIFKQLYARPIGGFIIASALLGMISSLFDDDDDERKPFMGFDPRSSKFLRPRIGDRYVTITGGLEQYVTLAAKVVTGQKKDKYGNIIPLRGEGASRLNTVSSELHRSLVSNKLSPELSMMLGLLNAREPFGEDLDTIGKKAGFVFKNTFVPLSIENICETLSKEGIPSGAVWTFFELLGYVNNDFGETGYGWAENDYVVARRELSKAMTNMERAKVKSQYPFLTKQKMLDKIRSNINRINKELPTYPESKKEQAIKAMEALKQEFVDMMK